jgi:hypothetical protein
MEEDSLATPACIRFDHLIEDMLKLRSPGRSNRKKPETGMNKALFVELCFSYRASEGNTKRCTKKARARIHFFPIAHNGQQH